MYRILLKGHSSPLTQYKAKKPLFFKFINVMHCFSDV